MYWTDCGTAPHPLLLNRLLKVNTSTPGESVCLIGYSDYDVFKKIVEVHGYIGVKSNSKTFFKTCFSKF